MRRHPSDAICSADLDGSIGYEPPEQPDTEQTHLVPCNARSVTRNEWRGLCGALVPSYLFARNGAPTCEECQRIDSEGVQALLSMKAWPS